MDYESVAVTNSVDKKKETKKKTQQKPLVKKKSTNPARRRIGIVGE
jgi:hypothetical protein